MPRPDYIEELREFNEHYGIPNTRETWEVGLVSTTEAYWLGILTLTDALKEKRRLEQLMATLDLEQLTAKFDAMLDQLDQLDQ